MKIGLALFLSLSFLAYAVEKYGIYDLQGNLISSFEAESNDLLNKVQQIKNANLQKKLYVSSLSKGKSSKPTSRYRYKAETGAYIEASRKETFSVCPDKEIQGTWVSEYSVALDEKNCLSVQAPDRAGSFDVLFIKNSGRTDTIQVLVEQSYIQMGDYSHKMWIPDSMPYKCRYSFCKMLPYGHYENKKYSQPLIVDKTKFTMGDAQYYYKYGNIEFENLRWERIYPKNEKLEKSLRPYVGAADFRFANERSKKEGLDTVYRIIDSRSYNSKDTKKLIILGNTNHASLHYLAMDTSASGYRFPFEDEWFFLMRAGAVTSYYWGDDIDSLTVSRYAWVRPIGLKPVAQLQPNKFGLYDMMGLTYEMFTYIYDERMDYIFGVKKYNGGYNTTAYCFDKPECNFIKEIETFVQYTGMQTSGQNCESKVDETESRCIDIEEKPVLKTERAKFKGFRLLRKTPKLHKLEKF